MFFAFNHPNYARWLVRYHDNLISIQDTHSGLQLNNGSLSIRRTSKPFSQNPIDLTLEQTINANAANGSTGIGPFTNSLPACLRWAQSLYLRSTIIYHMNERIGITQREEVTQDVRPHRIKKDSQQMKSIISFLLNCMNPFDYFSKDHPLVNLSSGKPASPETSDFLLNLTPIGENARLSFIKEYIDDPARFEKPIK